MNSKKKGRNSLRNGVKFLATRNLPSQFLYVQ